MISVIIPVFNNENFIIRALESVLAQTRLPSEIIIVDDYSSDASSTVVRSYLAAKTFPCKIILINNKENLGPGGARNVGVIKASEEWIAFLDADDIWHPRKLELQTDFISRFPIVDFLSHNSEVFRNAFSDIDGVVCEFKRIRLTGLLFRNVIPTRSVLGRRELFLKNKFNNKSYAEDFLCWLEVAASQARMVHLPFVLAYSFKLEYSAGGYSGDLANQERRELESLKALLNGASVLLKVVIIFALAFSLVKYIKRVFVRRLR